MSKSTQVQSLAEIQAQLKKQTEALAGRIQSGGGNRIKLTKDKNFQLPDGSKNPGPMNVVILDFVSQNQFFDRPWKEGDVTPPACFAIGDNPRTMVPDDTSPAKESEACTGCPNDEFGSKGAGKACANSRLLAIVEPGSDASAPIMLLKVPAGSIKAFDAYVSTIKSQFETMPVGVETEIYFDPAKEFQALLFGNPKPNEGLAVHYGRIQEAKDKLWAKPDVSQYEPPVKKKR